MKMVKSKSKYREALNEIRKELLKIEGVKAAVVINTNGELLGNGVPSFAQAVAEWMGHAELTSEDINADAPDEITLVTKSERIIVMRVDSEILLAARAEPEANQQLVSMEMLRAAEAIKELLKKKKRT